MPKSLRTYRASNIFSLFGRLCVGTSAVLAFATLVGHTGPAEAGNFSISLHFGSGTYYARQHNNSFYDISQRHGRFSPFGHFLGTERHVTHHFAYGGQPRGYSRAFGYFGGHYLGTGHGSVEHDRIQGGIYAYPPVHVQPQRSYQRQAVVPYSPRPLPPGMGIAPPAAAPDYGRQPTAALALVSADGPIIAPPPVLAKITVPATPISGDAGLIFDF